MGDIDSRVSKNLLIMGARIWIPLSTGHEACGYIMCPCFMVKFEIEYRGMRSNNVHIRIKCDPMNIEAFGRMHE